MATVKHAPVSAIADFVLRTADAFGSVDEARKWLNSKLPVKKWKALDGIGARVAFEIFGGLRKAAVHGSNQLFRSGNYTRHHSR